MDFLPASNEEDPPTRHTSDSRLRETSMLEHFVPSDPNVPYDMKIIVQKLVDEGNFYEIMPDYAKNIVIGFARFEGKSVGVVGNQPKELAGCLDINASIKAARFVRFCDAFNIPILTLVDVPGFLPGTVQVYALLDFEG